jgi:hypothetical protein
LPDLVATYNETCHLNASGLKFAIVLPAGNAEPGVSLSGGPQQRLEQLTKFCAMQRGHLLLATRSPAAARLAQAARPARDRAVQFATRAIEKCELAIRQQWSAAVGPAAEAAGAVSFANYVVRENQHK